MAMITAYCTDRGIIKEVNQDALLIKTASTNIGDIALIAVCDGMGGLQKGEVASSTMVKYLGKWFQEKLPQILPHYQQKEFIYSSLKDVIYEVNDKLMAISKEEAIKMGTTLTAMLVIGRQYYVAHVGDTRLYEIAGDIIQLTNDHTLVAREVKLYKMTQEEAERDPRKNLLLQCIGVSDKLVPDFLSGQMKENATYIICCDGFRHKLSEEEVREGFAGMMIQKETELFKRCHQLVELNKERMEKDNITVVALQYKGEKTC